MNPPSPSVPAAAASAPPGTSPARTLAEMLLGNQVQQAIHVAATLGIADLLRDGPKRSEELARAANAHPSALYRLLRALAGLGLFEEHDDRRFSVTPLGACLQSNGPQSVRAFALWSGAVSYQAFGGLEDSVRTGRPAFEHLFGMGFFDYLAAHAEIGELFDEMMSRHTAPIAAALTQFDFSAAGVLVDVGGGRGELLAAILRAHPAVHGVLVEQPRILDRARRDLERTGVIDRCAIVAADILEAVPPGDTYVLKSVLHGLSDDQAVRVLANCRRGMHGNGRAGRLLIVEMIIPEGNAPFPGKLMDLLMLVGCHGRERTASELGALLDAADFRLARVLPTKHAYSIAEGHPAW